jgi:hypothetical protein
VLVLFHPDASVLHAEDVRHAYGTGFP